MAEPANRSKGLHVNRYSVEGNRARNVEVRPLSDITGQKFLTTGMETMDMPSTLATKQGQSTATILTNRSRNQTVIRPFDQRRPFKAPSLAKGTRWMHRTTITLEERPNKDVMESSMQYAYSGKYVTSPPQRPRQCPSLQTSHFELGMNEQQHLTTHNDTEYPGRPIDHPNKVHYPSILNWSHNVTGQDMKDALSRRNHSPNYWSSYTDVHSRLGLQRGEGVKRETGPKVQYNLLTGQEIRQPEVSSQRLVSGNRVLNQARGHMGDQETFVLG
ncbi:uncharacterized protein [Apostichopus japonicus]|uniref:uncharacterized protein n=1 Tax=Stichopus japonicus TaxID=307972 RepID=UPI003AB8BD5F